MIVYFGYEKNIDTPAAPACGKDAIYDETIRFD